MSGLCSRHPVHDPDCALCNADVRELLPDYDEKLREAQAAGEVDCECCGFRFYRTTATCPRCSAWTWLDGGHRIIWPFHTAGHEGFGNPAFIGCFEYCD